MKLVLVIIKVKYRTMTSYFQYKNQYKYNIQYKFTPNLKYHADFVSFTIVHLHKNLKV